MKATSRTATTTNTHDGPALYHGRIVATPLLDPLQQEILGHTFNAPSYRMDAHRLVPGTGSLRHRPLPPSLFPAAAGTTTTTAEDDDHADWSTTTTAAAGGVFHPLLAAIAARPDDCAAAAAGVRIDVFLYPETNQRLDLPHVEPESSLHLELNRQAAEPVVRTLQRVGLNIQKKLRQETKAPRQRQRQQQQAKNTKRKPDSASSSSSLEDPVVWMVRNNNNKDKALIDLSAMTNLDFCNMILSHHEPFMVGLSLGDLLAENASDDDNLKQQQQQLHEHKLVLTVDVCPPTVASVKTFDDFDVRLFAGIPVTLTVETLYATHSRVDWYVDSVMEQTTTTSTMQTKHKGRHSFVPAEKDIGKRLFVMVKALRLPDEDTGENVKRHDGSGTEHAFQFLGLIEARPMTTILELRRSWLQREQQERHRQFRFLTYNILADQNAFSMTDGSPFYPYITKEMLEKRRRLPLVLHEIISYAADVVCLQEVDEAVFDSMLLPTFESLGYQGYYNGKVKDGTREGCATFWSLATFLPTETSEQRTYAIRDLVSIVDDYDDDTSDGGDRQESDEKIAALFRESPELRHILTERLGHVFQLVPLRLRGDVSSAACTTPAQPPNVCWVVNTHLFYHPLASHIRLIQAYLLSRQVGKILRSTGSTARPDGGDVCCAALIVTGDFNSSLRSAAVKLLLDRSVPENYRDNRDHLNTFKWEKQDLSSGNNEVEEEERTSPRDFPSVQVSGDFTVLRSAFVPELEFTHYVGGFIGTLDHILVSEQLQCTAYAPMPSQADVTTELAMPSSSIPSDHVCLVCDLSYR